MFKRLEKLKLTREECREVLANIPRQNREDWLKIASALVSEITEWNDAQKKMNLNKNREALYLCGTRGFICFEKI